MSTEFYNRNWRMPKSSNSNKVSNYSMSFDGSSEYIDCGTSSGLEITGDVSISAWVYITTSGFQGIVAKRDSGGTNYQLYTDSSPTPKLRFFDGSAATSSTGTVSLNAWHHVAITVDSGVDYGSIFYIDGVPSGTAKFTITSNDAALIIGALNTGSYGSFFNGKIDHVAIFDYALSSSQITSLYGNSTDGVGNPMSISPKPKAYYPIGDYAAFNGSEYLVPNLADENVYSRYAFSFDGVNNYFDAGVISSLVSTTNFTVSGWFNFNSTISNKALFSYGGATNTQYSFALQTQLNKLRFYFAFFLNDAGNRYVESSMSLSTSTWYHIAVTYDGNETGNTNRAKIYVDGANVTATGSGTINSTTTASSGSFNIGRWDISSGRFLDGKADEVSIWDTALTSTQITELYNQGKPSNLNNHSAYSNLVSWWQLGENSSFNTNWTVLDEKGTNNGTSVNMGEGAILNGVGTSANGLSDGMGGADNIIGDAPYSTGNAVSYGMGVDAKSTDVPS